MTGIWRQQYTNTGQYGSLLVVSALNHLCSSNNTVNNCKQSVRYSQFARILLINLYKRKQLGCYVKTVCGNVALVFSGKYFPEEASCYPTRMVKVSWEKSLGRSHRLMLVGSTHTVCCNIEQACSLHTHTYR